MAIGQYRITKAFSLDPATGFGETNFMVEHKKGLFGRWTPEGMYVSEQEAIEAITKALLGAGEDSNP